VPAEAERGEHEDAATQILVVPAVQQRHQRHRGEHGRGDPQRLRIAGDAAHYAGALPRIPFGRTIRTSNSTTRATASCNPVPMYCEPNASRPPYTIPPTSAPCTVPRP